MKLFSDSILVMILITITVSACNSKNKEVKERFDQLSSAKSDKNQTTYPDSINITADNVTITGLPFGSNLLITSKFPESWAPTDYDSDSVQVVPNDKNLFKVMQEYDKLNNVRTFKGPQISSKKYILLGRDSLISKDRRAFDNDFRYRLPNIDKYELYYVYHPYNLDGNEATTQIVNKVAGYYTNIGSLILYERKNRLANVIIVTFNLSFSDNNYNVDRFFYVDANSTIKIFEYSGDEALRSFQETQEINIMPGGNIVVKNIN